MDINTKKCTKCKNYKKYECFRNALPGKGDKFNLRSHCRECEAESSRISSATKRRYDDAYKEKNKLQRRVDRLQHPERKLLSDSKYRAKEKGLEFNLTIDDIIIPKFCPIFGIELQIAEKIHKDFSPSLDRIDNSKGYVKGNVQIISLKANRVKNNASLEELKKLVNYLENL